RIMLHSSSHWTLTKTWSDNLYRGILADDKRYDKVPLVEGHYQDAYLLAERAFSESAPTIPGPEDCSAALVQQVLSAQTPRDVLGVPEEISMRALNRRFVALTKTLGQLGEEGDPAAAFRKVKEAYDSIRAERPEKTVEAPE
ncbi:unnamed protein product, partial [Polarella glacialis]